MWFVAIAWAADPSGKWALAEDEAALAETHARALADGLSKLPWGFRPFAKPALTGAVKNCRTLLLATTATGLSATCDGERGATFSLEAPASLTGGDGKTYAVTLLREGDTWSLTFAGEDGGQKVVYDDCDPKAFQEAIRPFHRNQWHSDAVARLFAEISDGRTPGHRTDTFRKIMGRPGRSFREYLATLA